MAIQIYPSEERGKTQIGWLNSAHSFSFGGAFMPNRMGFGALRVLNDDNLAPKAGFPRHPHSNMEIISIPLEGELIHQDSMGNSGSIQEGEVQIMSAGKGITHSEFNGSQSNPVKFLQIWIIPNKEEVEPRYDQISLNSEVNQWQQILSPNKEDEGSWIHQEAWMKIANIQAGKTLEYKLNKEDNGLFLFLIDGELEVEGEKVKSRDAAEISNLKSMNLKATAESRILGIEVPMK